MRWTHLPISPEDIVPLFIFANYLEMSNGPLWNACRTDGYCYGVAFDFDAETNLIILSINECSQIKLAYANALETLVNLVQRKTELDPKLINASRNLTICVLTENLATLGRAAHVCMNSYLDTYSIEKYKDFITELNSLITKKLC
jgi:Zn-dependent M16 (insulinase) family peptidase